MNSVSSNKKPLPLNENNLESIQSAVLKPNYIRSNLSAGILHIGVGNFHRAHLSWYLHRLMQKDLAKDWAIIGSGITQYDVKMREGLQVQDFLTTLIELDPEGNQSCEVVGPMIGYVPVEKNNQKLIIAMSDSNIRIVSLTVTEGGYFLDENGDFNLKHPDIIHDINNPDIPKTVFGVIVSALKNRKKNNIGPFTGLSCDNLMQNGNKLKQAITGIAKEQDLELSEWINQNCTFPNAMVDCIVPRTGEIEIDIVRNLGIEDLAPVSHEDFRQWVIEDKFCKGRPPWEKVGVQFSDNVHGYEDQKIRILNGGHQILANAAELLNIETVRDAMKNKMIVSLLEKIEKDEIIPHIKPVPGYTPLEYYELIASRFSNPSIQDTTRRVAFDGSSRHAGFLVPSIKDGIKHNISIIGLSLAEALWARMCEGTREDGSIIEPNDPHWEKLNACAKKSKENPLEWLEQLEIYGDTSKDDKFRDYFSKWLKMIYQEGVENTLNEYLK
ncbi:mannitol dehydrogenase family protein [Alphaproteobacteria bacterium]|nr:mannitol dehydrogenase family protein [Alphaproteobacteria bacterium]MDC0594316.1 mannitol dehydrogenase family protein [Alphaproteobacteria bacterium]MDC0967565.1 mannitol dehydrogenase family protein [Alphaproteobacteria bacterium]